MRVSFDTRLMGFAGIGRFIVGLWAALLDEGVDLVALGPRQASVDLLGPVASVNHLGSAAYDTPGPAVSVRPRPLLPAEQVVLPWLLRRHGIDVHHSPHLVVPYAARRPVVLTVHDLFMYKDPSRARSRAAGAYYRTVFPLAVRRADLVVGGSTYASREVQEVLGVAAAKVRTVDYGLDHAKWNRPAEDAIDAVVRGHGLPVPYLLYVGTAKSYKNLATLLAAHARDPELPPMVLAGPTGDELAEGAPGHSAVPGRVIVLGRVPDADLPALYAGAVALCLPSLYESVGFTSLEAMACGTPVVASDGGGIPDAVGDAAIVVPAADVDAWTDALRRVSSDDALRTDLRSRGHARAASRSWPRAAQAYKAIYEEVAR